MAGPSRTPGEVVIGVIGPQDEVERVMLSATAVEPGEAPRRLVAAVCRHDEEAPEQAVRLCGRVDACLFAGPVPYHHARKAGGLTVPVTHVALNGSALYATLLRSVRRYDVERISLDVLTRADVEEAYGELGLRTSHLRLAEGGPDAAHAAVFHQRLWEHGAISVALTCMCAVAQRLSASGVPVMPVRATEGSIRCALRTAALLARQHQLRAAQFTLAVIEVPALRGMLSRYARDELRLTVHRFLVQEARRMQTVVSPVDDHSFVITATREAMAEAGAHGEAAGPGGEPPFAARARSELGVALEVGVGTGRTVAEAESRARLSLRGATPPPTEPGGAPKSAQTLVALARLLRDTAPPLVVDAETAARLLGVTSRTARRLLRTLAEDGLAWPLPPSPCSQPGRPRQNYRLITERLG